MPLDFFFKPKTLEKYPAYAGYTVHQSTYDALQAECDRAHELNETLQSQLKTAEEIVLELRQELDELKARPVTGTPKKRTKKVEAK